MAMNAGTAWYALERVAAYAIDLALVWAPMGLLLEFGQPFLKHSQPRLQLFTWVGAWGFTAVGPVLINGILTGLTGRSPGKFIMFLNVQDFGGDPPGIATGILREIIKAVSLGFFFGMIWALQGVVTRDQTFYDQWLNLEVEDLRPVGLTETQKNWRKYHRAQARRNRR
jgi:uncharacterized RDD family membrane protein YckC